jgi:hypothetical protein
MGIAFYAFSTPWSTPGSIAWAVARFGSNGVKSTNVEHLAVKLLLFRVAALPVRWVCNVSEDFQFEALAGTNVLVVVLVWQAYAVGRVETWGKHTSRGAFALAVPAAVFVVEGVQKGGVGSCAGVSVNLLALDSQEESFVSVGPSRVRQVTGDHTPLDDVGGGRVCDNAFGGTPLAVALQAVVCEVDCGACLKAVESDERELIGIVRGKADNSDGASCGILEEMAVGFFLFLETEALPNFVTMTEVGVVFAARPDHVRVVIAASTGSAVGFKLGRSAEAGALEDTRLFSFNEGFVVDTCRDVGCGVGA